MLLNRARAEEKMEEYDLEALIATSSSNVFYASNLCPYGKCFAILPRDPKIEPAIIAPISGPTPIALMSEPWIDDVRYYGEFYTTTQYAQEPLNSAELKLIQAQESWERTKVADPTSAIIGLLKERNIVSGKVGVDESNLPLGHQFWRRLKNDLQSLEPVSAQKIFSEIRMIKSEEEIERIKKAIRITEEAWETALEQSKEGMTEREFEEIFQQTVFSKGGKIVPYMGMYGFPLAFGRRTAFVDIAQPSNYRLKSGDLIRFDGGCSYMGYPCDMARTAVLGEPDQKLEKYYEAILAGEQAAIEMAEPGVISSEIFRKAVETVRKNGIPHYRRHHTGHGWGIDGYDPPLIGPNDNTRLEEGMLLCFETPYYEVGRGGPMVEDVILITKNKARFLTEAERELRIIRH